MIGGDIGTFGINDISRIGEIIQEAARQNTIAINELDYCNKRQEDILHEIELGSSNHHTLGKLARELRDIRIRRRIAKNTISIVKPILQWCENYGNPKNRLFNAIGETRRIDKELRETTYHYKTEEDRIISHVNYEDVK